MEMANMTVKPDLEILLKKAKDYISVTHQLLNINDLCCFTNIILLGINRMNDNYYLLMRYDVYNLQLPEINDTIIIELIFDTSNEIIGHKPFIIENAKLQQ